MNPSCLRPQVDDNFETNSDIQIRNNRRYKYRRISDDDSLSTYSNKSYSFNTRKIFVDLKSPLYIDKVKKLQNFIRFCLSVKKFNERVDLLTNILELDATVNLIKDQKTENNLLLNNAGEQLSIRLIKQNIIKKYKYSRYYRINIKKYKPSKYLVKTPLTYIDKYKNNDLYIGTWTLEKKFHGYGIYYTSGNKYEGFWNFGKLIGESRKFFQNNDYFIGTFFENSLNSFGKYYHNDGTIYEGNWYKNYPHGKGKEIFADGSKFEGLFENGFKKKGKFTWVDGSYYDGDINNNYFEGFGTFKWKEGRKYVGNWKNGKMNGKGIMTYIDGAKYEGEFVNGKREGKGNYYWNSNKYYKGSWKKGKQDGDGYFYHNGRGIIGVWKEGKIKQCLSQEENNDLIKNKTSEERSRSPQAKYMNKNCSYINDLTNISTNLSNNISMKDIKVTKRPYDNLSRRENRSRIDINNSTKNIYKRKSMNDIYVMSDYSTNKSKVTNIEVLFKNDNNNNNRNKKNVLTKKSENNTWRNTGFYRKYKNKK